MFCEISGTCDQPSVCMCEKVMVAVFVCLFVCQCCSLKMADFYLTSLGVFGEFFIY